MDRTNRLLTQAGRENLKQDICNYYKGILVVLVYIIVMDCFFGRMCPMVLLTGFPCPACGLTRAGLYVLTLNWDLAWQMNPMIFPIGIAIVYAVVCRYVRGVTIYGWQILVALLAVLLIGCYLYRIITGFSWEANTHSPMAYSPHNLLRYIYQMTVGR